MKTVKLGDKISINYRGLTEDGEEFESTFDKDPFEFTLGETKLISGFQKALIGMKENETKNISVPPEEGYGKHNSDLIAVLNKNELPVNTVTTVGWMLKIGTYKVTIIASDKETVTLDGNHPLVDKTLTFEINMLEIL